MGKYLDIIRKARSEREGETTVEEAVRLIGEMGYLVVRSKTLGGEVVIWVKDERVAIPERWRNAVTYTLEELRRIAERRVPSEELRKLHEAKRLFEGRIEGEEVTR